MLSSNTSQGEGKIECGLIVHFNRRVNHGRLLFLFQYLFTYTDGAVEIPFLFFSIEL